MQFVVLNEEMVRLRDSLYAGFKADAQVALDNKLDRLEFLEQFQLKCDVDLALQLEKEAASDRERLVVVETVMVFSHGDFYFNRKSYKMGLIVGRSWKKD